jgi:hypothetical protein
MVPASVGLVLLGAYIYTSVRRADPAVSRVLIDDQRKQPEVIATDLMFERLQTLKLEREAERANEENQGPPGDAGGPPGE